MKTAIELVRQTRGSTKVLVFKKRRRKESLSQRTKKTFSGKSNIETQTTHERQGCTHRPSCHHFHVVSCLASPSRSSADKHETLSPFDVIFVLTLRVRMKLKYDFCLFDWKPSVTFLHHNSKIHQFFILLCCYSWWLLFGVGWLPVNHVSWRRWISR
jgi:hypothetical protein